MNPDADKLWQAPRWALAVLLAVLGMLGPFSIDTYIPAFSGIAQSIGATPAEMQQTLSAYLFGFAFMNLFHGALSDSFGRRPVVLWGLAVFTVASLGCALSQNITQLVLFRGLQGLSTGAGIVVSRAVIRDMFPPAEAQRVMSQVTIYFGVAPAIAPIVGGFLFVHAGWHAVFWFLVAVGVVLFAANYKLLPETLHKTHRQPFQVRHLLRGYWDLCSDPRFLLLAFASGVPFNGMFLYVLAAPAFLGDRLALQPQQFFWFFLLTIGGIMLGARASGRMAGKVAPKRQIRDGFLIMLVTSVVNVVANFFFQAHVAWALWPLAVFAFGWALMVPVVTLLVLDLHPERRGMASSLQAVIGSTANGIVAGAVAPLVMHSTLALALTSLSMLAIGLVAWVWLHGRWPEIGRMVAHEG
ncbi:MFS transporter, DHA1 family, bicyclomycin/chloramphenicol resistance protein [Variovorax sp. OK605]|jgi:DHA1 family bicyclomycin/chloramphenicol resistance-like MFS transporter|uniref:multidrug effflux MFS transporter n=1 Tax=unclassified Variovorax TaxID=663243 RepID=UPI0008BA5D7D|nr:MULTISPECIES: multidrug effflux MFS transporter [unclassified Variovorax]SEJ29003.1 MFS transporter, DHA1 family, bicyclomycin/chloramphenicol resistance protein [Variovorax sp. OK202]SFC22581.1 MFS transporter, DHA1 family, bicyclomycin/chloramphenicol resistance protein [Variovorax sp. OK212]SFO77823.1 MFS transporter, DHA1 family, bicyclomycin/chloramphenicol resistance protein [Variovorax sp. OK605]